MHVNELSTVAGTVFMVSDRLGNISPGEAQGLFAADTRYLARYDVRIGSAETVLLQSGSPTRGRSEIYATNAGARGLPAHVLELYRRRELADEFSETIELTNRGEQPLDITISVVCDTDFADIFEVRTGPDNIAQRRRVSYDSEMLVLSDRRRPHTRQTQVHFDPAPDRLSRCTASFRPRLEGGKTWTLTVRVRWVTPEPETELPVPVARPLDEEELVSDWLDHVPVLDTDDIDLSLAYRNAIEDLAMLEIALDSGHPIPAAGLPWYLAIFGRDSIITSLQCLLTGRRQAYGTLRTLAAYQASENDAFRDAEPGKIAHEIRFGELAVSERIPHARYYGTVDATPLWIVLLREAIAWSGNLRLARELLPAMESALRWTDDHGDLDGDGLIEYQRRSGPGLVNQGWKDSWDSVRFGDGRIAEGPIALVEVQGYVVAARQAAAEIYGLLGDQQRAAELRGQAESMRKLLHDAFWMPDEGYYALALDGEKRQVDSITSNPGHLLWSGALDQERAVNVVERLGARDLFSGWGIRTMSSSMGAYNPFSYHNGTVWPHDNSIIAAGMARYGCQRQAMDVIDGMLDAATYFDRNRLPELFCGYARDQTSFPVDYPVACSPQAWASGSVILMLQTMAGITPGDGELGVDPLPHGRTLRLQGVRYLGQTYALECGPGKTSVEVLAGDPAASGPV